MVDERVQGALLARVIIYWMICLVSVFCMCAIWKNWSTPSIMVGDAFRQTARQLGPGLFGSLLILPLLLVDVVRLTNRIVSPVSRLRWNMQRLADGDSVPPMRVRADDFWPDAATTFNKLLERVATDGRAWRAENLEVVEK
jgi:hypothetical protein